MKQKFMLVGCTAIAMVLPTMAERSVYEAIRKGKKVYDE